MGAMLQVRARPRPAERAVRKLRSCLMISIYPRSDGRRVWEAMDLVEAATEACSTAAEGSM